jgi:hypothetical protein
MYYKITKVGEPKYSDMGMVDVMASFYLEDKDEGYVNYIKEHYVQLPVIPEGGYRGEVNEIGVPVDIKDYKTWVASLPTVQQLNPFCNHSIQFEHDVTEADIRYCFDLALATTHQNYLLDDLHCQKGGQVVNQDINYSVRKDYYENTKQIPEASQTLAMKAELAKIPLAKAKETSLSYLVVK